MPIPTKGKTAPRVTTPAAAKTPKPKANDRRPYLGELVYYRPSNSDDPAIFHDGVRPGDIRPAMVVRIKDPEGEPMVVDLRVVNVGILNGEENVGSSAHDKPHGTELGQWSFVGE